MDKLNHHHIARWLLVLIATVLIARLISLGLYPLYDTTEARYGEMARLMAQTNNWVTPLFDYDVPFWGKPPAQTWISAASFKLLGVTEFSARLPHFLCSLITLALIFSLLKQYVNRHVAWLGVVVLVSTIGFTLAAGVVMTDSALLMATTLAMVSFWRCFNQHNPTLHGHLFFVALSLGMLIKGPVAIVIIGIALVFWSIYQRCFVQAIKSLPWFTGLIVFFALTLPWYIWAEIRSPGFLEYFIVGEHIQRFLVSGWQGDLYGTAHQQPRGMIWMFWLGCAFPWSFIIIQRFITAIWNKTWRAPAQQPVSLTGYAAFWMLAPLLLFSSSGNILPAYVLPGLSAVAILIALTPMKHWLFSSLAGASSLLLLCAMLVVVGGHLSKESEKTLLHPTSGSEQNLQLYYWKKRPFSAQFYSQGRAKLIDSFVQLNRQLDSKQEFLLVMTHTQYNVHIEALGSRCTPLRSSKSKQLIQCNG